MADHQHDWREFNRFFPLGELATDPDWLSPDGAHVNADAKLTVSASGRKSLGLADGDEVAHGDLVPLSAFAHPPIADPTPYVAFQCADADCRHVVHVDLTDAEWAKIQEAYELGALDPDANGTHRLLSQLSLDDLGLTRIAGKLSGKARALSGAVESLDDADGSRFVSGDASAVNERARDTMRRSLGLGGSK